jgi:hypothetical protein
MIWPTDAGRLAFTKLKTRKIRLTITVIISSILFSILLAASFTMRGAINSVEKFSQNGFGSRYLASAYPLDSSFSFFSDQDLIAKAKDLQKQDQAKKTAEAKRLGIEYDPKNDVQYVTPLGEPAGNQDQLNIQAAPVMQLIKAKLAAQPGQKADFVKTAKKFGATNIYSSFSQMSTLSFSPPYIKVLKDGAEDFSTRQNFGPPSNGIDSISTQWQLMSAKLMQPFLLNGQNLQVGADGSVPVVAPYSAVEQILGLKPLPSSASAQVKLLRLKTVREKAAGYLFSVCYRNTTSSQQLQDALSQQEQIAQSKSTKGYVLPELIKDKPAQACGPVTVTRDVRTADEKSQAAKQEQFNQEFGEAAAASSTMQLRIVGINSDPDQGGSASLISLFQSVLISSLGIGWFSPVETTNASPMLSQVFNGVTPDSPASSYFAEFPAPAQLKKYLDNQNCQTNFQGPPPGPNFDPFKACRDRGIYFSVGPFGSSAAALDDLKKTFNKFFTIATAGVALLAALIMMGTVGRIIADSRRETAVFRAIGAKRGDIWQIYLTYTLMLASLIAAVSLSAAFILSHILSQHYAQQLTVNALVAFNVQDLSQKFVLSTFYARDIMFIIALVICAAILSAIVPLLTNVRRSPIKDMRDER